MTSSGLRLLRRLRYLFRFPTNGAALSEELAFHREMIEHDALARGLSPADARNEARRAMGNETFMREEARAVWLWPSFESAWQDLRYAMRGLRRDLGVTIGVTVTLALGIGANAAMFSLVDQLLFRPPARMIDPASVSRVYLYRTSRGTESSTGGQYRRYADMAAWSTTFSQTAGFARYLLAVGVRSDTRLLPIAAVSASFFQFFDAPPLVGRYFSASEDSPRQPTPVVVLSYSMWTTEYGSRRDMLGKVIQIGNARYTVIGVAPSDFVGLWPSNSPAAFVPLTAYAASEGPRNWATTYGHAINITMIGRRKRDVSMTAASADVTNALRRSYLAELGSGATAAQMNDLRPRAIAASVLTERGPERSSVASVAIWSAGVALIVLLISCANVANLLLARALRRRREIAVRVALGVSRVRLLSQLLTEGVLLAALGGLFGVLAAGWGSAILRTTFLNDSSHGSLIADSRTLIFSGVVVLAVGVLTGLAPMSQAGRLMLTDDLKAGARDASRHRQTLRTGLVLFQSALSVVLLVGAGLFVRSVGNVRDTRLGFDVDPVMRIDIHARGVPLDSAATTALRLRLLETAKQMPGVAHATLQEATPLGGMSSYSLFVTGVDSVSALGEFDVNAVSSDYFVTMGTRLVRGRGLLPSDVEGARRVLVVGQSMANVLWPGQDALDRCVRVRADTAPCRYVVGIAEDIHSHTIEPESKMFYYYLPAAQWRPQEGGLFVRAHHDASLVAEPLRRQLQREMPGASYVTVTPLAKVVGATTRSWVLGARVFTAFGVLALVLAAVGLYSVIAYDVAQRKHEIGVRLALGADRARITRLVVGQGMRVATFGIAAGCVIALVAGRWIQPLLFMQSPRDSGVFAVVGLALFFVAATASSLPALRAANVDPKTALQSD